MNFSINLATRVYVDFKKVNLCCLAAAAILICWLFLSLYTYVGNTAKLQKFSEYKAKLSHGADVKKVSEADYTAFLAKVKTVNSILYKQSYDWLPLFANLERLVPEGVVLKGLAPSDKGKVLRLSASSRNFSGVRKFIENLENSQVFSEIYLTDQTQAATKDGAQKLLNFTVTCKVPAL